MNKNIVFITAIPNAKTADGLDKIDYTVLNQNYPGISLIKMLENKYEDMMNEEDTTS